MRAHENALVSEYGFASLFSDVYIIRGERKSRHAYVCVIEMSHIPENGYNIAMCVRVCACIVRVQ